MTGGDMAVTFPETTLTAGDLTLRPFSPSDIDDVVSACQDVETLRWLPLPRPYTKADAEWFIGTFGPTQRASGEGVVFAIESAGRLAGAIDLKRVNWVTKVAEVGYWVAPWARGRGVASGAARALSLWAIRDHGFERVELFAATGNTASRRAAVRAGFVREGVARNACCVNGRRMDMVLFSLVPNDLLTSGELGSVTEDQEQDDRSLG
jgi:RimJ/RimL family protein N-acetyltransferase